MQFIVFLPEAVMQVPAQICYPLVLFVPAPAVCVNPVTDQVHELMRYGTGGVSTFNQMDFPGLAWHMDFAGLVYDAGAPKGAAVVLTFQVKCGRHQVLGCVPNENLGVVLAVHWEPEHANHPRKVSVGQAVFAMYCEHSQTGVTTS